jgi:RNA polymerase sigma factor for flagellar operon FliA
MANSTARQQLITDHLDVARRIALRVGRRVPWLSREDLVAAAMVGLAEAASRYELGRAEPFVAFAEQRIRGAVLDELRRNDVLPRRVRRTARRVEQVKQRLAHGLGRAAETDEIAAALGVTVEHYHAELEKLAHVDLLAREGQEHLSEAGNAARPATPHEQVEQRELARDLRAALAELPARDQTLLALYYNEELSYAEIGKVLGVSESRICQLHGRLVATLRARLDGARTQHAA